MKSNTRIFPDLQQRTFLTKHPYGWEIDMQHDDSNQYSFEMEKYPDANKYWSMVDW